jgi:2-polyprenyl-3-methyl-5-hydroxy-6-metoxy-1,4-benzoquinol methylase
MSFIEEDVRPHQLIEEYERLFAADLVHLIERRADFDPIDCPACGDAGRSNEFEKGGFSFVRCGTCQTLYVSPRPPAPMLLEFYRSSRSVRFWDENLYRATEETRRLSIFRPRAARVVELARRHGGRGGVLADVGCGYGTFCDEMKALGFFDRVIGVEPSGVLAEACRSRGLEVVALPIEEARLEGVSLVTAFELVEHLHRPIDFVRACHRALPPGGLLILTTPNIQGFDLATLGPLSDNIAGPAHLNYFHGASITRLLGRVGFTVLEVLTPGELDAEIVRKQALAGHLDLSSQPFLHKVLLEAWDDLGRPFQAFLADHGLSSHMWVVARRRDAPDRC